MNKIKKKQDECTKKLNQYKTFQEILDINPSQIKEIDDFNKKYDIRYRLWKNRETFASNQYHWYRDNFLELDANEIFSSVKDYEKECVMLKAQIGRDQKDEVLEQLTTDVKLVSNNLNLIQALGNKNM